MPTETNPAAPAATDADAGGIVEIPKEHKDLLGRIGVDPGELLGGADGKLEL